MKQLDINSYEANLHLACISVLMKVCAKLVRIFQELKSDVQVEMKGFDDALLYGHDMGNSVFKMLSCDSFLSVCKITSGFSALSQNLSTAIFVNYVLDHAV